MLSIISWRNVWRSKGRSLVVIGAIVLGIWALTFGLGFMRTFITNYVDNAISEQFAHIQIHQPDFQSNKDIQLYIENSDQLIREIHQMDSVHSLSPRVVVNGMISSAKTANGATVYGVSPEQEAATFGLDQSIVEGSFFEEVKRNPVLIGHDLAEKLQVEVKSKIVLTFTDMNNNITAGAFRIAGIFDANSPVLNQSAVYVRRDDLVRLIDQPGVIHEIAIKLDDQEYVAAFHQQLKAKYPDLSVLSWRELAPELELIINQSMVSLYILLAIIMLALAFGIVNTMLMAVLERMKEIGMLMAIGMKKTRVFFMIILETIMISLVGGPIGLLLGFVTIKIFHQTGLDLSDYSQGLEKLGYDSVLYPGLELKYYLIIALGVIVTAILAAIYPAIKAIKLKPVEALAKL
ncbi:MAG: ABC transporter permease [Candidatus Cyclobacteriaceae bacterium M3_2C_046]